MKLSKLIPLCAVASAFCACSSPQVKAPEAILPIPEQKQVDWQKMETYAFIHFGLNTFNDREWGYGDTVPKSFNPTNLDCEQWAQTLVKAGMKGVILTAKHHDGFCLWPFEGTDYSVKNSPWKNGQGNVVKELSEACKKYGLKFAVYLSPWDRHQANYGTPEYLPYFYAQLHDLLTNYGPVFEVWFDGANGGDGWYGGAKDIRTIDRKNYYNYPRIYEMLDSIQPQAIIFSDGGPGCRWVGNEKGFAGATNWSFLRKGEVHPGYDKSYELQYGHPDGNQWVPAECDVSIRPGWFYHEHEDGKVKTLAQLVDIYYNSVGRNSVLLLNVPPDKCGLIHATDVERMRQLNEYLQRNFANNLVKDGSCARTVEAGKSVMYDFAKPADVNTVVVCEDIAKGQRIEAFAVSVLCDGKWKEVATGTTVGYKRIVRFPTVKASAVKVDFTQARADVNVRAVEAYCTEVLADKAAEEVVSDIPTDKWTVVSVTGKDVKNARLAVDGKKETHWRSKGGKFPKQVTVDLKQTVNIAGFRYLPIQGDDKAGTVYNYKFYVSNDGKNWKECSCSGEFSNIMHNPILQIVEFGKTYEARYFRFEALSEIDSRDFVTVGELGLIVK